MKNSKSTEATLKALLTNSTSERLRTCLLQSLKNAPTSEREALAAFLAPVSVEADVEKHCVRCHNDYTENEDHSRACTIDHNEDGECERTLPGYEDMTTTVACCGISFDSHKGPDSEDCIVEWHTTDLNRVNYHEDGGPNENVGNCETFGCCEELESGEE